MNIVNHELIYLFRHSRENGNPASFKYDYRMDARQKNSSMTVTLNMNDYSYREGSICCKALASFTSISLLSIDGITIVFLLKNMDFSVSE